MNELLSLLNSLVEKYGISEEDVAKIQEAISKVEGSEDEDFAYSEETVEE